MIDKKLTSRKDILRQLSLIGLEINSLNTTLHLCKNDDERKRNKKKIAFYVKKAQYLKDKLATLHD